MAWKEGVDALLTRLAATPEIDAWCDARYGRYLRLIRGIRKPGRDQDYPCVCVGLLGETGNGAIRTQRVGVAWFIRQPTIQETEGTTDYLGELEVADLGELIVGAVASRLSLRNDQHFQIDAGAEIETLSELMRQHPYYWGEAEFNLNLTRLRK